MNATNDAAYSLSLSRLSSRRGVLDRGGVCFFMSLLAVLFKDADDGPNEDDKEANGVIEEEWSEGCVVCDFNCRVGEGVCDLGTGLEEGCGDCVL